MSPSCVNEQILNGIIRKIQIVKNAIGEKNLRETQSSPSGLMAETVCRKLCDMWHLYFEWSIHEVGGGILQKKVASFLHHKLDELIIYAG